ncbi:helix-turn-helix protein [compost metagenome]
MERKEAFGVALRLARNAQGLSQDSFGDVSGRTYIGAVESGRKNPTVEKVSEFASVLGLHPLTLLALAFSLAEDVPPNALLKNCKAELTQLLKEIDKAG